MHYHSVHLWVHIQIVQMRVFGFVTVRVTGCFDQTRVGCLLRLKLLGISMGLVVDSRFAEDSAFCGKLHTPVKEVRLAERPVHQIFSDYTVLRFPARRFHKHCIYLLQSGFLNILYFS